MSEATELGESRIRPGVSAEASVRPASDSTHSARLLRVSLTQTAEILSRVDELAKETTGAFVFEDGKNKGGALLVEERRICWAVTPNLKRRLVEVLREQALGSIEVGGFEAVFRSCKEDRKPFGEALVERGLVTEGGLRRALRQHTAEAIAHLSTWGRPPHFLPHRQKSYNPRFTFSSADIFCAVGGLRDAALATEASSRLLEILPGRASGVVYSRDLGATPVALGCWEERPLAVEDIVATASWASGTLDIAKAVTDGLRFLCAKDTAGRSVALWQEQQLMYVALCQNSSVLERLARNLEQKEPR